MKKIILGLGSNQGDRFMFLQTALVQLQIAGIHCLYVSSVVCSSPEGYISEEEYLNAAVFCETKLLPHDVLKTVKSIEKEQGRTLTNILADRTLDIDILFYEDLNINDLHLQLPHPRIWNRAFVMEPLKQLFERKECIEAFGQYVQKVKESNLASGIKIFQQKLEIPLNGEGHVGMKS